MDKTQKIILTITSIILAILLLIIFGKVFKFERNKEVPEGNTVPETLIDDLYSYLPTANDYGLETVYNGYYSSFSGLSPAIVEQMIINYLVKHDSDKVESLSEVELRTVIDNTSTRPLYKISNDNMMYGLKKVFGENKTFRVTDVSIDYNTKAYFRNNYLYVFTDQSNMTNNYEIYKGKISYSVDDDKTIKIVDYYLKCDKLTNVCYNDEKQKNVNDKVTYSSNLKITDYINDLQQYQHVFKLNNTDYYWESSSKK